jgi:hypothetical protein
VAGVVLAGEPADDLGSVTGLTEGAFDEVGGPDPLGPQLTSGLMRAPEAVMTSLMVARPPVRLRLKILGAKLDRAVASRDEQGLAELDDLAYRVLAVLWLSEQGAGALEGVDEQEDRYSALGIPRRFLIVPLPSPGSVASDYLEREGAFRGREFPCVTVDEMLRPQREIRYVLGLVMLDKKRGVLEEVVDAVPCERPAYREDDLRVAARWRGGVHDDFPLDHLGMDVIGEHLDDLVRSPHIIKDRRRQADRAAWQPRENKVPGLRASGYPGSGRAVPVRLHG